MYEKYYIPITIHDENAQNQEALKSLIYKHFHQEHM